MTTATATRMTTDQARAHYAAGGGLIVATTDKGQTMDVYPSTNVNRPDHQTFEQLLALIRVWSTNYPGQTFYAVHDPDTAAVDADGWPLGLHGPGRWAAPCPGVPFTDGTDVRRCAHPIGDHGPYGCEHFGTGSGNRHSADSMHGCPCSVSWHGGTAVL